MKELSSTAAVMHLKTHTDAVLTSTRTQDTVQKHPLGVKVTSGDTSRAMSVGAFQNLYKKQIWRDVPAKAVPAANG